MLEEIRQTYRRTKQGYSAMVEIAWEQKKTKRKDSAANTQGSKHHQLVPNQYNGGKPMVKGI